MSLYFFYNSLSPSLFYLLIDFRHCELIWFSDHFYDQFLKLEIFQISKLLNILKLIALKCQKYFSEFLDILPPHFYNNILLILSHFSHLGQSHKLHFYLIESISVYHNILEWDIVMLNVILMEKRKSSCELKHDLKNLGWWECVGCEVVLEIGSKAEFHIEILIFPILVVDIILGDSIDGESRETRWLNLEIELLDQIELFFKIWVSVWNLI